MWGIKGKAGVQTGVQIVFVAYKDYLKSTGYVTLANPIINLTVSGSVRPPQNPSSSLESGFFVVSQGFMD